MRCQVIIFVIDSHAIDMIVLARKELHRLLEGEKCIFVMMTSADRELASTPLLVQH